MSVVYGGRIGAEFFVFFCWGVCWEAKFWSGSGGGGNFLLAKIGLVRELVGETPRWGYNNLEGKWWEDSAQSREPIISMR